MKQQSSLEGLSDGRLYDINDMVKADTGGCDECSACCHDVGDLVVLTPYDVFQLSYKLKLTYKQLLETHLERHVENKIALPHLRMTGDSKRCTFLNAENRCDVHAYRPNICRLFPLGRVYEEDDFKYFLQLNACIKPKLEKVKVKKWIQIDHYKENKAFILSWYKLIKALTFRLKFIRDEKELQSLNNYLAETFYQIAETLQEDGYSPEAFYAEYNKRLPDAKSYLGIL